MFEYIFMQSSQAVRTLQQRITEMQPLRLDERNLPTAQALKPLLPGGALQKGSSYAVHNSQQLAFAMLAAASASGAWCGIIGCPDFGAESAASLGVALDRCILIPDAGAESVGLAGALSEVLTVVLLHTPRAPGAKDAERIAARLREHGSALVVTGAWPRVESTLQVTSSRWTGLGSGHGLLEQRELSVQSRDRRGIRQHTVRFVGGALADSAAAPVRSLHTPTTPAHSMSAVAG